jgi:signal-transduction protein with cAMP-binding, CBS, and nucleotidyltransferase domain
MGSAPLTVSTDATCGEVVRLMRERSASSTIVEDEAGRLAGIVTEQDVVRRIAFQRLAETPVTEVMSTQVRTIREDDYLYHAIAKMRSGRLQHMPVVDEHGRAVGILQQHHALVEAASETVELINRLTHSDTLEGMRYTKSAQVLLARRMLQDNLPAPAVQSLLTRINNDLYQRIVELCLREMKQDGWGEPPVKFAVIVMGSGGRGESFLKPDQDNGFILDDYPATEHGRVDRWFIELAERMTRALDEVGFMYCTGHVMATNPLWRKTLPQWKTQTRYWLRRSARMIYRLCDIFFDFTLVYGERRMATELRRHVTEIATDRPFLREMYRINEGQGVALNFFGGLQKSRENGPNYGKINLKLAGTLPLVNAVRVFALREQLPMTSTLSRIEGLYQKGVLDYDEYDYLIGAFRHITLLLLDQQLKDFKSGHAVGNHIVPGALSKRNRDILVDGFKAIRSFRNRVRMELTAGLS